ncbi:MAG: ATP-binding protein [Myxococcota bacterium]
MRAPFRFGASVFNRVLTAVVGGGLVAIAIATASILLVVGDAQEAELAEAALAEASGARERLEGSVKLARAELAASALTAGQGNILEVPALVSAPLVAVRCTRVGQELVAAGADEALLDRVRSVPAVEPGRLVMLDTEHAVLSTVVREVRAVGVIHLPTVLQSTPGWRVSVVEALADEPAVADARMTGGIVVTRSEASNGEEFLRAVAASNLGVTLAVEAPTAPARAAALTITTDVVLVSLIAILPLLLVAIVLARAVTSPIRRLAQAVRGAGPKGVDLPTLPKDEIGELGDAIAGLSQQSREEAQALRATLSFYRRVAYLRSPDSVLAELQEALRKALPTAEWFVLPIQDVRQGDVPKKIELSRTQLIRACEEGSFVDDGTETFSRGAGRMRRIGDSQLLFPLADGNEPVGVLAGQHVVDEFSVRRAELLARAAAFGLRNLGLLQSTLKNERLAVLGRLSASLAHELNNPLAYVMSNLALLEEELDGELGEAAEDAAAGAERLRRIVDDLSSATRGAVSVNIDRLELGNLLRVVRRVAQARSPETTLIVEAPEPIYGFADRTRLEQVLVNLLANGIDAVKGQPEAEVRARLSTEDGRAVIRVSDNGGGVPAEVRPKLFDAFFTTKGQAGTGLGLFLSRQYVGAQGGSLSLEHTGSGGTTFRIDLRLAPRASEAPERASEPLPRHDVQVLVIDDEPGVVRGLSRWLGRHVEVTGVTDPQKGLSLALEGDFALVLCDVNMPGLLGTDLIPSLLERRPDMEERVVLMTGSVSVSGTEIPLLRKPLDRGRVLELVHGAR